MPKQTQAPVLTKVPIDLTFHRAGILDIPLIYELMLDGAVAGAFSEDFVQRTGSTKLLGFIARSVVMQYFQLGNSRFSYEWLVINISSGEEVGFLKLRKSMPTHLDRNLELLAVSPAHRNKGIGSTVLNRLETEVPSGGKLYVYCTKYARAMQRILKTQQLKRNTKFHVPNLEEYQSDFAGLAPQTGYRSQDGLQKTREC